MQEPFWNTKDNWHKTAELKKNRDGYCLGCNKPRTSGHIYCGSCSYYLITTGLEESRVKIGTVGKSVINYQQHLHNKFFGCHQNIKYRGVATSRIYTKIKPETIEKAANKLRKMMIGWDNEHSRLYWKIKDSRNIDKRLLFYIIFYFIDYHIICNDKFKHLSHFQASMIQNFLLGIERTYIRMDYGSVSKAKGKRGHYRLNFYYKLYADLCQIVEPLMAEIALRK